jgi:hypothetical protein
MSIYLKMYIALFATIHCIIDEVNCQGYLLINYEIDFYFITAMYCYLYICGIFVKNLL